MEETLFQKDSYSLFQDPSSPYFIFPCIATRAKSFQRTLRHSVQNVQRVRLIKKKRQIQLRLIFFHHNLRNVCRERFPTLWSKTYNALERIKSVLKDLEEPKQRIEKQGRKEKAEGRKGKSTGVDQSRKRRRRATESGCPFAVAFLTDIDH